MLNRRSFFAALILAAFAMPLAAGSNVAAQTGAEPSPAAKPKTAKPKAARPKATASNQKNVVYLDTKDGRITIRLRPDLAPKAVAQIETLTKQGFYNGLVFHRVIAGFMAQTGDPTGTGSGGSNLPNLPAEFSQTPFKRGTIGMARTDDPNSANSQFFICLADASFLNGKYTVVGEVTSGMDVVDKIKKGSEADNGKVENPDKIVKMQLAGDAGPAKKTAQKHAKKVAKKPAETPAAAPATSPAAAAPNGQ